MGRLSTHVLDTASGRPAQDVPVTLHLIGSDGNAVQVASARTNADGRTDAPLVAGEALVAGCYELRFSVGAYFKDSGATLSEPPFLDEVPIRFGVSDPAGHYHVPLLISPWSYSTYRGS